jgi:hypothetical protein
MDNPRACIPVTGHVKFDGFTLRSGESIYSSSYYLSYDSWHQKLEMKDNGNLVLYQRYGKNGFWIEISRHTYNHPGAYAVFQDDGNLVIYTGDTPRIALWASNTDQAGTDNYGKGIFFQVPDEGPMSIFVQKTNSHEYRIVYL